MSGANTVSSGKRVKDVVARAKPCSCADRQEGASSNMKNDSTPTTPEYRWIAFVLELSIRQLIFVPLKVAEFWYP